MGHSSPGYLQRAQQPSKTVRQIPHVSSAASSRSHCHSATAWKELIFIFIVMVHVDDVGCTGDQVAAGESDSMSRMSEGSCEVKERARVEDALLIRDSARWGLPCQHQYTLALA